MTLYKTFSRFVIGAYDPSPSGTSELIWRAAWIVVSVILVSYASYLYFGSVNAAYFGEPEPISIVDVIKKKASIISQVISPSPPHVTALLSFHTRSMRLTIDLCLQRGKNQRVAVNPLAKVARLAL